LYAAVEGRGPFDNRGNSIAILAAIANEEAPRPRSAGPLRQVIEALLNRNPQVRPDAAAVSRLLAAASAARTSAAETGGAGASATRASSAAGTGTPQDAGRRAGQPLLTAPLGLAIPGPPAQAPASGISQPGTPRPDGQWEGPDDPWPEGSWPGNSRSRNAWPETLRSEDPRSGNPWPGGPPESGDAPWASQIPTPDDPPAAGPPAPRAQIPRALAPRALAPRALAARLQAGRVQAAPVQAGRVRAAPERAGPEQAARAHAAGPVAGRHGAPAPGLRRGLAAELAAVLPRGRRGLLVILGALAIVGAGILAGLALTHGGSGSGSPAGGQAAGQTGSAAGFSMTVPAGWQTAQHGGSATFSSPAGDVSILVTPGSAGAGQGLGQTRRLLAQALKQGRFPGYQPLGRRPFLFAGRAGVAWQFTWQPARGGRLEVRDIAFRTAAPGGGRAFRVQESAPVASWAASQPEFRQALSTFRASS
jgi:hypothetical protein